MAGSNAASVPSGQTFSEVVNELVSKTSMNSVQVEAGALLALSAINLTPGAADTVLAPFVVNFVRDLLVTHPETVPFEADTLSAVEALVARRNAVEVAEAALALAVSEREALVASVVGVPAAVVRMAAGAAPARVPRKPRAAKAGVVPIRRGHQGRQARSASDPQQAS